MSWAKFGFALTVAMALHEVAYAQSTIFNIPTTDTVAPRNAYFEFDYLPQVPTTEGIAQTQIFTPRIVTGIANNLEAGANFANYRYGSGPTSRSSTFSYFQPNIKYKFAANDNEGLAAAAGLIWYTPINHRDGADSYGLVYANFSKKV
jgi:hypothetical protein